MTTDGSNHEGGQPGAKPEGLDTGATPEPPEWFKGYVAKQDAKTADFGRQLAKIHERLPKAKDDERATNPTASAPQGLTREDVTAAMRLGETKAKLNEVARTKLDAMLENGMGFAQALQMAEILAEVSGAGASPSSTGAKPPIGHAATAAHSPAPGWPSKREYVELVRTRATDKAAAARLSALQDDPAFDPNSLK